MRGINVYKTSVISKTFMKSGLKVLYYHPLSKTKTKKTKTKTKTKLSDLLINLYKNVKQTSLYSFLDIWANILEFTRDHSIQTQLYLLAQLLHISIDLFLFNIGFKRLTVLMNDFRLKTFYNNHKTNKTTLLLSFNINHQLLSINKRSKQTSATTSSTSSSASPLPTNVALFKSSSSNNNHHRTYNNSSKSNKVFLYYTPRDPRLRIFLKTKQFFIRPDVNNKNKNKNLCDNKILLNILYDLCNYGELIGCSNNNIDKNNNKNQSEQFLQRVSLTATSYSDNNTKRDINNNLNKSIEICEKFPIQISDNICVVAAAITAVANYNNIATISRLANISIDLFIATVIVSNFVTRELLFKFIAVALSLFNIQQQLKNLDVKTSLDLCENIL